MSDSDSLHIAQRMSALLARELGEGIDSKRMVAQPLYARDVLLVCQALRGTTLPELAQEFIDLRDGVVRPAAAPAATAVFAATTSSAVTTPATAPSPAAAGAPAADSQSNEPPDSNPPSGWRASLWPATMRGSLFGALGKGRKRGAAPRS